MKAWRTEPRGSSYDWEGVECYNFKPDSHALFSIEVQALVLSLSFSLFSLLSLFSLFLLIFVFSMRFSEEEKVLSLHSLLPFSFLRSLSSA